MLFTCKGELNVVLIVIAAETVRTPGNDKGSGVKASFVIFPAIPPQSLKLNPFTLGVRFPWFYKYTKIYGRKCYLHWQLCNFIIM